MDQDPEYGVNGVLGAAMMGVLHPCDKPIGVGLVGVLYFCVSAIGVGLVGVLYFFLSTDEVDLVGVMFSLFKIAGSIDCSTAAVFAVL